MRIACWLVAVVIVGVAPITSPLFCESQLDSASAAEKATAAGDINASSAADNTRTRNGLLALYDFRSSSGAFVKDRSGVGDPVNLRLTNIKSVRRAEGSLEVRGKTLIRSDMAASKITDSIRRSGEITIEAWIQPAKTNQSGPARIVTLSKNSTERNFTLGHDGDQFDVRFRTTKTNPNGIPSLSSAGKGTTTKLRHVVYTRNRRGRTRFYVDGKQSQERTISGDASNWNGSFRLALANELSKDRPWQGTYYLVAIYSRGLSPKEVEQNFQAGAGTKPKPALLTQNTPLSASDRPRTRRGLQALYDFGSSSGAIIKDRSGVGQPVNLRITDMKSVRRAEGSLAVRGKTLIRSDQAASKIIDSIRKSGEITIEAWIQSAETNQSGPARIVTLSKDSGARNFTLGQDGDRLDARFRTTKTNANGIPSLSSAGKKLTTALTHVVYTRDRGGETRMYINGEPSKKGKVAGNASNWDGSFRLALANELSNDRPWLGTYHLVAIYNSDLSPQEIEQNYQAGAGAEAAPAQLAQRDPAAELFVNRIAPLLSRHCLECHDSSTHEGGLDLSRKDAALAGGESGRVIVAGKAAESLLWEYVESDTMPENRPPLSPAEKALLRKWLDDGAVWSLNLIDPAIYAHDRRAGENWLRRLTVPEYIETVRSAVGVDIAQEARAILPPDVRADGFSNTAYNLNVDLKHVEAYSQLAEIIVERMDVVAFAAQFSKSQKFTDKDMGALISKMGKWLLRGPLEEHEIIAFRGISTTVASAGGEFKDAVRYIIEAMLQSPRFIYRVENQRGDGMAWPVDEYELASRLSYIVWGGPPDKELMRAADAGELDRSGVESQVQRMLQDPRAIDRSIRFIYEWLNLARLDNLRPNPDKFPKWNEKLAADMREETLAFCKDVVWKQQRPLSDLLNAQVTFVTPRLADHYGLPSPDAGGKKDNELSRYDLSSVPSRGGLLTQGSVLTVGGDEASMVTRGLFVLHDLLRGVVKDPPPCVDTTPVPSKPGLTQRGVAEARIANEACGGCHAKFEPLAFGLEKFDGLGAFHETDEHGNKLREDGKILFPGKAKPVAYQSSAELMDLLAGSERVRESITWKLTQFALARPLVAADAPILEKIHASAQQGGGTYASLITAIVMSDLVQLTRTEEESDH